MAVMTYLVRLSISELVGVTVVKAGPVHAVFTVTRTSTTGSNSTVQVRLGEEPAIIVPTGVVTFTVNGSVTTKHNFSNMSVLDMQKCVDLQTLAHDPSPPYNHPNHDERKPHGRSE